MKKLSLYLMLFVAAGTLFLACSKNPDHPKFVVAKGNGFQITRGDLTAERNFQLRLRNIPVEQLPKEQAAMFDEQILEQMIDKALLLAQAQKQSDPEADKKATDILDRMKKNFKDEKAFNEQLKKSDISAKQLKQEIKEQILIENFVDSQTKEGDLVVTEDQIKSFYNDHPEFWEKPEQVKTRHILVLTPKNATAEEKAAKKKEIEAAHQRILKGEDFAKVAAEVSQDPASKEHGGELPFFSKGRMVPEFEKAAFSQGKGTVGPVFETKYGYHFLQVMEKEASRTIKLDEVKDQIQKMLVRRLKAGSIHKIIQDLRAKANIQRFLAEPKMNDMVPAPKVEKKEKAPAPKAEEKAPKK